MPLSPPLPPPPSPPSPPSSTSSRSPTSPHHHPPILLNNQVYRRHVRLESIANMLPSSSLSAAVSAVEEPHTCDQHTTPPVPVRGRAMAGHMTEQAPQPRTFDTERALGSSMWRLPSFTLRDGGECGLLAPLPHLPNWGRLRGASGGGCVNLAPSACIKSCVTITGRFCTAKTRRSSYYGSMATSEDCVCNFLSEGPKEQRT